MSQTGKNWAQVLIRWSLQRGFGQSPPPLHATRRHRPPACADGRPVLPGLTVPLPKSDTPSRIAANADVFDFELSSEQMARLDGLDEGAKGACSWNPVGVE